MTEWQLYLTTRLDDIKTFFAILCVLAGFTCAVHITWFLTIFQDPQPDYIQQQKIKVRAMQCAMMCLALGVVTVLVPTTANVMLIWGI